jgi:hypothetical protein
MQENFTLDLEITEFRPMRVHLNSLSCLHSNTSQSAFSFHLPLCIVRVLFMSTSVVHHDSFHQHYDRFRYYSEFSEIQNMGRGHREREGVDALFGPLNTILRYAIYRKKKQTVFLA